MSSASRWKDALELASKKESGWRRMSKKIIARYRGDDCMDEMGEKKKETFNILWSNIETLRPSLYNRTPTPDIRRRYDDKDPIAKAISELLNRSTEYCMDAYDFDGAMVAAVHDSLLTGRGVTRVRYEPVMGSPDEQEEQADIADGDFTDAKENEAPETDDPAEPTQEVVYQKVCLEPVAWDDFRCEPVRRWADVTWVAFRLFLTKQQLMEKFGHEKAASVPLDHTSLEKADTDNDNQADEKKEENNRGKVWEIWDKASRKVIWMAPESDSPVLLVEDDTLELSGFFPCAAPLYQTEDTTSLIPIPDFKLYQTLADDLDRTTLRIIGLTKAMKVRGIYDSSLPELDHLYDDGDATLIPAQNVTALLERGGLDKAIWFAPLETLIVTMRELVAHREVIKASIYEVTGISDIMRGQTVASETMGAQQLKSQWGTLRLQRRQRAVQRYARDLLRLMTEVISEKFDPQTFTIMTGIRHLTNEQKAMAQQQVMMAQQSGQPVLPEMQEQLSAPTWEEILSVLRDEMVLSYRVDVETDSTIQADEMQEKQDMTELMAGMSQFVATIGPAVQSGYLPIEVAKSLMLSAVRKFKAGGELEAAIENIQPPPAQPQQDDGSKAQLQMQQMQMQHEQQLKQADIQHQQAMKSAELQNSQQVEAIKAATEQAKIQSDERIAQLNAQTEQQRMALDHEKNMAALMQAEASDRRSMMTRGEVSV